MSEKNHSPEEDFAWQVCASLSDKGHEAIPVVADDKVTAINIEGVEVPFDVDIRAARPYASVNKITVLRGGAVSRGTLNRVAEALIAERPKVVKHNDDQAARAAHNEAGNAARLKSEVVLKDTAWSYSRPFWGTPDAKSADTERISMYCPCSVKILMSDFIEADAEALTADLREATARITAMLKALEEKYTQKKAQS